MENRIKHLEEIERKTQQNTEKANKRVKEILASRKRHNDKLIQKVKQFEDQQLLLEEE